MVGQPKKSGLVRKIRGAWKEEEGLGKVPVSAGNPRVAPITTRPDI